MMMARHALGRSIPVLGALALIWVLGLALLSPTLAGPWLLDDSKLLDRFDQIRDTGAGSLADGAWKQYVFLSTGGGGRPLAMVSLSLNALVADGPLGFKAVNLVLHLVTASFVFLLARSLFRRFDGAGERAAGWAALAVALIWALHPLQVSTFAYVVQRMTVLSGLFGVLALWSYTRLRLNALSGEGPSGPIAWSLPLVLLPLLGMLSKETGALIPFLLLLLEATLFRFRGPGTLRRVLLGYFALIGLIALAGTLWLMLATDFLANRYQGLPFGPDERLLTQARVMVLYLGQILLPRLGDMPFYYDGLAHSAGWMAPPWTLGSAVILAGALALGVWLLGRRPLAGFGILFFFTGHLVESTILPLELAFEHRNYLPSLGIFLAVASLITWIPGRLSRWRLVIGVVLVAAVAALGTARSLTWAQEEQIYLTAIQSRWPSGRAGAELAQRLAERGQVDVARALLQQMPGAGARLQEGYLDCRSTGRLAPARIEGARQALGGWLSPYEVSALIIASNMALDQTCAVPLGDLTALLEAAVQVDRVAPQSRQNLWMYLAHLRHAVGDASGAEQALESAFRAQPASPLPLLLGATWALEAGAMQAAQQLYDRARQVPYSSRLDLAQHFLAIEEGLGIAGETPQ